LTRGDPSARRTLTPIALLSTAPLAKPASTGTEMNRLGGAEPGARAVAAQADQRADRPIQKIATRIDAQHPLMLSPESIRILQGIWP